MKYVVFQSQDHKFYIGVSSLYLLLIRPEISVGKKLGHSHLDTL